jgi:hypothetical protein
MKRPLFVLSSCAAVVAALLLAWPHAALAKKGKPRPETTRLDDALAFLTGQISPAGLLESFPGESNDYAYTYDNALAALAFLSAGDSASAARVLDAFATLAPEPEGGFLHRYRASDAGPAGGLLRAGHNAYLLKALLRYRFETGDTAYDVLAQQLGAYLVSLQDVDGGIFGAAEARWKSAENNLAAYSALHDLGALLAQPSFEASAEAVRDFLLDECWNGTRFWAGEADPTIVSDAQALGVLVLGPAFASGPDFAEEHTLAAARLRGTWITGFDLNADRDTVWTEGTLQQALALSRLADGARSDFYRAQAEQLARSSGALLEATHRGTTGFGDFFERREAVAPTAWYVFLAIDDGFLAPLP